MLRLRLTRSTSGDDQGSLNSNKQIIAIFSLERCKLKESFFGRRWKLRKLGKDLQSRILWRQSMSELKWQSLGKMSGAWRKQDLFRKNTKNYDFPKKTGASRTHQSAMRVRSNTFGLR